MSVGTPEIGVYCAFGNKPTDPSFTFDTDITTYVRDMHYKRGRTVVLNQIETGSGDATLDDSTRVFDPNNSASPYYPNVQPMKPIQARAALAIPADGGLLTMSGNEITDLIRTAGLQGDGLTPPAGIGIWENTTNLCTNSGFETNATGHIASGGNTIVRSTAITPKFGTACGLATTDGVGVGLDVFSITLTAAFHTSSVWIWIPSAYDGGGIQLVSANFTGEVSPVAGTANMSLRDQWQRIVASTTPVAGDLSGDFRVIRTGAAPTAGRFIYTDGWQIEQKLIATPTVPTDGGTASRSGARVQAPASLISATLGWFTIQFRVGWSATAGPGGGTGTPFLFDWRTDTNNRYSLFYSEASRVWTLSRRVGGVADFCSTAGLQNFNAGDTIKLTAAWDATNLYLSINGGAFVVVPSSHIPSPTSTTFDIGQAQSGVWSDSNTLMFVCGKGAVANADAATFSGYTATTVPDASQLLWPPLSRPTMVWKAVTGAYRVSTDATLFTHFVARWPRKRIGRNYAERGITTIDGFDLLSLAGVGGKTYSSQQSGAMITAILNDANWSSSLRSIAAGDSALDTQTFTSTDSTKALPLIQDLVGPGGENGLFYINGRGFAVFINRHAQFGPPYNTSQATFTDLVTVPGEFGVTDIAPASDKDLIFDDWSGTRPAGATQQAIDSTSILNFGRRSKTVTSRLTTNSETLSSMQYSLSIFKNPLQRIESITIKPGNYAELWIQCLSREIGDRITVKEHPPGGGQADVRDYIIQSIDAKFSIGPVGSAVYTWGLFPASAAVFILDDLTNGVLNTSPVGY